MDAPKKFEIFRENHFGIGLRWAWWDDEFHISLALPFVTVSAMVFRKGGE